MTNQTGIDNFCGETFWNDDILNDKDFLNVSRCFQHSVLLWIPTIFLFTTSPILLCCEPIAKSDSGRPGRWPNLLIAKLVTIGLIIIESLVVLVHNIVEALDTEQTVATIDLIYPAIQLITMIYLTVMCVVSFYRKTTSFGVIFVTLLMNAILGIVELRFQLTSVIDSDLDLFHFCCFLLYYLLILVAIGLEFASMPYEYTVVADQKKCFPEPRASFISRITYWWLNSLMYLGWKRPLSFDDLWSLNKEETTEELAKVWEKYWNPVINSHMKDVKEAQSDTEVPPPPSIIWRLFLCFKWSFMIGSIQYFCLDLLQFANPQILRLLVRFVEDPNQPNWVGYFYTTLLFLCNFIYSLLLHHYFNLAVRLGMYMKSIVISAIFQKSLKLSNDGKKEFETGEIVNLMATDAQKFFDVSSYLNDIWSAPFEILLSFIFLWNTLGVSVIAGVIVIAILIPVNVFAAVKQKRYQFTQMKWKDERIKLMNEVLSGVKVLKLYAWEPPFEEEINRIRAKELRVLRLASYISAFTQFTWTCAPFLMTAATFVTFVLSSDENVLTAEIAFVSLSLFNIMRYPLTVLPMMVTFMIQASVSNGRIKRFLAADELENSPISQSDGGAIKVEDGNFAWSSNATEPILKGIQMNVKKGSLVAVVGQVGAGKSSLIQAMLGEMNATSPSVLSLKGTVAYVPQQAWIQNRTLRENITFMKPLNQTLYDNVVDCCAMRPDLEMLPGGDQTEIGEKGINLSGGQKQRISLARAVYQDTDVYLLDDPLSAVDSHVAKHLFEHVIGPNGLLKSKTRVLVTHGINFLKYVDVIYVMSKGRITEWGSYHQLLQNRGEFALYLETHLLEHVGHPETGEEEEDFSDVLSDVSSLDPDFREKLVRTLSQFSATGESRVSDNLTPTSRSNGVGRSISVISTKKLPEATVELERKPHKLIEAEYMETGKTKLAVYTAYLKAIGYGIFVVILLIYASSNAFSIAGSTWLSDWSTDANFNRSEPAMRAGGYVGLGLSQCILVLLGCLLLSYSTINASGNLHKNLLHNVMRSSVSFFETTPLGRIINRFSKDIDVVDNTIPQTLQSWLSCILSVVSTLIVIIYSTPIFAVVLPPLGVIYWLIQRFYVVTSRQLKRLESVSRSPIYSHFQETISGAASIRAYKAQQHFISMSQGRVDVNQVCGLTSWISNRWLGVRLELIGNLIVIFAALFAVVERDTIDPGLAGLSISYALTITTNLLWIVRMTCDLETNIVGVERIKEYTETPTEADWNSQNPPSAEWPSSGEVHFDHLKVRYRPGLDLVLKDIDCRIRDGEKIGIVGRTGAGKSSLTLALFRIIEAAEGAIVIDSLDVSKLGLHELRSKITIIPQDPVLFSGTLRFNLDPFNAYSDQQLWSALELSHLKEFVSSVSGQLDYAVTQGGDNLSVGQRQLVCLARALLRKTKILVLDEATAAVDLSTDLLIQQTIRVEFGDSTIITIAHRLNTILDSDRVMVLDSGLIREFDSPTELLNNRNSFFYSMAKDASLVA